MCTLTHTYSENFVVQRINRRRYTTKNNIILHSKKKRKAKFK